MKYDRRDILIIIGNKIRIIRKSKGYSQEGFAKYCELGRTYMGRIERGEQNISALNMVKIAVCLNVEITDILPTLSEVLNDA